jgi:hypothetical protein
MSNRRGDCAGRCLIMHVCNEVTRMQCYQDFTAGAELTALLMVCTIHATPSCASWALQVFKLLEQYCEGYMFLEGSRRWMSLHNHRAKVMVVKRVQHSALAT